MIINNISNIQFEARIKINKPKFEEKILKCTGSSMIGGASTASSSGAAFGADMVAHISNDAVPVMQHSSSLFDQFADMGHKLFNAALPKYEHNGYDASFFSSSSGATGIGAYVKGMNTLIKGIDKEFTNRNIPT